MPFTTTNPDHVFEIHPVTRVDDQSTLLSFQRISGFTCKKADAAFQRYENIRSEIGCGSESATITTGMARYNYAEFVMELNENPADDTPDGLTVMSGALDKGGSLLVRNRRIVFVKGRQPYERVKDFKEGDLLRVLGIPRIDLAILFWRYANANERSEALTRNLPCEIIAVAVLGK